MSALAQTNTPRSATKTALFVTADQKIAWSVEWRLTRLGHDALWGITGADTEELVDNFPIQVAVIDWNVTSGTREVILDLLKVRKIPALQCLDVHLASFAIALLGAVE